MTVKQKFIIILAGCVIACLLMFLLPGCSSFSPIQIKGQPAECNDWFSAMKFYDKKQPDTMLLTVYQSCSQARIRAREKNCKQWIFGNGQIDKNKYPEYGHLLECLK
jgi:hypothetical protein